MSDVLDKLGGMNSNAAIADFEHQLGLLPAVLVDEVRAVEVALAAVEARKIRALAAVQSWILSAGIDRDTEMRLRSAAAEIAGVSKIHGRTVVGRMDEAWMFIEQFSATVDALERGEITLAHARVIRREGLNLPEPERAAFELIALDRAQHESPRRLESILRSVSEEFVTTSIADRHRAALKERTVYVTDVGDGMSDLCARIPSHIAHGILDGLTTLAGSVKLANKRARKAWSGRIAEAELAGFAADELPADVAATDLRTMNQIRADAFCDLLLTGSPAVHGDAEAALQAVVHITIPALSLLGHSDAPADLAGSGPIDVETAKRLAGAASTWERLITSPIQGQILAVDTYRPSEKQRRLLRARDERCRFQGCRAKPWHGDLDHSTDFAFGGATANDNLAHLCRYHHTMKHAMGWQVKQLPHGLIEWTDPSGRTYVDVPPHVARFVPTDELPPGAPRPRVQRDLDVWVGVDEERETGEPEGWDIRHDPGRLSASATAAAGAWDAPGTLPF